MALAEEVAVRKKESEENRPDATGCFTRGEKSRKNMSVELLRGLMVGAVVGGALLMGPAVSAQDRQSAFATIGEGYTAPTVSQGVSVEWRAFTGTDFPALCEAPAAKTVARLRSRQRSIKVAVGEFFSFGTLKVSAVDALGLPVGPVPITVAIEEGPQPVVDLRAYKLTGKNLRALRPGVFRVRIRTLCGVERGREREVVLRYIVRSN